MKATLKTVLLSALMMGGVLLSNGVYSQAPPPPGEHGSGTNKSPLAPPLREEKPFSWPLPPPTPEGSG